MPGSQLKQEVKHDSHTQKHPHTHTHKKLMYPIPSVGGGMDITHQGQTSSTNPETDRGYKSLLT